MNQELESNHYQLWWKWSLKGLALTRKICGILSKKLQKLALLKLFSNLSVKATVFCYFFDIPQILQV